MRIQGIYFYLFGEGKTLGITVLNSAEKVKSILFSRPFGFQSGKSLQFGRKCSIGCLTKNIH